MSHTDSLELYYLCLQKSSEIQKKRHLEAYGRKDEKVPTGKVFLMVRNQNNSNNNINCNSNNSNNNSNSSSPTQQQQQQQQQQRSNQANSSRYKTELCRPFEENGVCKYGDKCQFAHGYQELRNLQRHPKYKTELCRSFHTTGFCPYGPRCHFIHNSEESKQSMLSTLSIYLLR